MVFFTNGFFEYDSFTIMKSVKDQPKNKANKHNYLPDSLWLKERQVAKGIVVIGTATGVRLGRSLE